MTSSEFQANSAVQAAWRAAAASACSKENSALIRIAITSTEAVAARRRNLAEVNDEVKLLLRHERESKKQVLSSLKVNFQVSYTLQDFQSSDASVLTTTMRTNYYQSVTDSSFGTQFATELKQRSDMSDAAIAQIQPADVTLSTSYSVIDTLNQPSVSPTARPTTGMLE
jgi:hypothetical protein